MARNKFPQKSEALYLREYCSNHKGYIATVVIKTYGGVHNGVRHLSALYHNTCQGRAAAAGQPHDRRPEDRLVCRVGVLTRDRIDSGDLVHLQEHHEL